MWFFHGTVTLHTHNHALDEVNNSLVTLCIMLNRCEDHAQAHQLTQRTRKDMEQRD